MRKKLLLSVIIFQAWCLTGWAQNLVLNPSFENTSSCPQGISEFSLCSNWSITTGTFDDTCTTPDLYSTCSPVIGGVNVPNALLGYQRARTGTNFAGIILGDGLPDGRSTYDNYREYIEGQLSSPLKADSQYLVTFYMNLADATMFASNSIGVYFSDTLYLHDACPNALIKLTPQLNFCGPAITDTANWVPVTWLYTATGGEQHFIIGNFNDDTTTNLAVFNSVLYENPYIYYYIDDVSVAPYAQAPNQCAFAVLTDSVNTACQESNGSAGVTAYGCTSPFTYLWSTGGTADTLHNITGGTYTVTVTDALHCQVTASVIVNVAGPRITFSNSAPSICGSYDGSIAVTIAGAIGPFRYLWSNGDTLPLVTGLRSGAYTITVTDSLGCSAAANDTLIPTGGLLIGWGKGAAVCYTPTGYAYAYVVSGPGPYSYQWSNGGTTDTIYNLVPGFYQVTASDTSGCSVTAVMFVDSSGLPIHFTETPVVCSDSNGSITLNISGGNPPYSYKWANGDSTQSITGLAGGYYPVTVSDSYGCSSNDIILLNGTNAPTLVLSSTAATCGSNNGTATVQAGPGSGPFTYLWSNTGITQTITQLTPGIYTVTVTVPGACSATASVRVADSSSLPPVITLSPLSPVVCPGANINFSTSVLNGGTSPVYEWFVNFAPAGDTIATYNFSSANVDDTVYVKVTSSTPCPGFIAYSDTAIIHITTPPVQQLCIVTTDTALQGNIVVWEKADKYATDSFYIYRADTTGTGYAEIAAIGRDSLSEYYDVSSSPVQMSYRYKINLLDTCGNLSAMSNYHQTIYLHSLGSGSFVWTPYEIENTPSPVTSYNFYRDSSGNGNWQLLEVLSAAVTSFTDTGWANCTNPRYKIVVNLSDPCVPTRSGFTTITSNVSQSFSTSTAINETSPSLNVRLLYNPVHDKAEIVNITQPATLQLTDNLGRLLKTTYTSSPQTSFDLNLLAPGLYYVRVNMGSYTSILKVVKY